MVIGIVRDAIGGFLFVLTFQRAGSCFISLPVEILGKSRVDLVYISGWWQGYYESGKIMCTPFFSMCGRVSTDLGFIIFFII